VVPLEVPSDSLGPKAVLSPQAQDPLNDLGGCLARPVHSNRPLGLQAGQPTLRIRLLPALERGLGDLEEPIGLGIASNTAGVLENSLIQSNSSSWHSSAPPFLLRTNLAQIVPGGLTHHMGGLLLTPLPDRSGLGEEDQAFVIHGVACTSRGTVGFDLLKWAARTAQDGGEGIPSGHFP
jgi:hypothetical protein